MAVKEPAGLVKKNNDLFKRTGRDVTYFWTSFQRKYLTQLLICFAIIFAAFLISMTPLLERFEYVLLDNFFRMRPPLKQHSAIAFIEIAEDSVQQIGRWPWPRRYHAAMAAILQEYGASATVFDVIFSEPSDPVEDGALEEALQKSQHVYLSTTLEDTADGNKIWIETMPEMVKFAKGIGHFNIIPDSDGTLRRVQPYLEYQGKKYPHLAVKVAYDYLQQPLPAADYLPFPVDKDQRLFINWAGKWKDTFEHFSYVDVIQSYQAVKNGGVPRIDLTRLKGKICLIGLTAFGHADIKASAIEPAYPAVGVHANVINSILNQQWMRPASFVTNTVCLLIIGLLASLLFVLYRNVAAFALGLSLGVIWITAAYYVFSKQGIWLNVIHPLFEIFLLYAFSTCYVLILNKKEQSRLFHLATRDGLTGLYVIRHFRVLLNQMVEESFQRRRPLSLILFDIDHFKKINDTHGHIAGDMVLKEMAKLLQSSVREDRLPSDMDCIGRYGGEEFIIALGNCALASAAFNVAERVRKLVESHNFVWQGARIPVTISLGVGTLHAGETVPDLMVHRADQALYRAKEDGRNRTRLESEETQPAA